MAESIKKIYFDFKSGIIGSRELLHRLSAWDCQNDESQEEFKRNVRLKRTIVTELMRYAGLNDNEKKINLKYLSKKYLREYLYAIVICSEDSGSFTFTDYVQRVISTHSIPKEQYDKLENRDDFWNAVSEIEDEIINNSYMAYKKKWNRPNSLCGEV